MSLEQLYLDLPDCLFQSIQPEPLKNPKLVVFNDELANTLDLPEPIKTQNAEYLVGNQLVDNSTSLALGYTGHQFGNLNPQLGDGRAHLLGQVLKDDSTWMDLQLKGSGRTRYSRGGDGRATLKSALREYIVSEYVSKLGISTCRSLFVASADDKIMRNEIEQSAVVCRVAKSHIRIGSFQFAAMHQDPDVLKALADFTIKQLYPDLENSDNPYLNLYNIVQENLIELVVSWMVNGFIHGVMNTDNILVSGETIDFGPCAFMGAYHPEQVFSSIDQQGRYAFKNQPGIMQWNLARFAESLIPLVDRDETHAIELLSGFLNRYVESYQHAYHLAMSQKLALDPNSSSTQQLIVDFLSTLETENLDFRNTFSDIFKSQTTDKPQYPICSTDWYQNWLVHRDEAQFEQSQQQQTLYHPSNYEIEKLLSICVEEPQKSTMFINDFLNQIDDTSANRLNNQDTNFDLSYKTFCGT